MSKITTVYNKIIEKLSELYPDKQRIPNAYSLTDNNDNLLRDSFGLKVGSADFEELEFCNFVVNRTFSVVLTREMFRLESSTGEFDDRSVKMLEDVYEVQELFFNYNELGIGDDILRVQIGSASEVTAFNGDKSNFLSMEASFTFSIKEEFKGA
jgi:hypothetical protein